MEESTYPITMLGAEILGRRLQPEREYKVKLYDFKRPDKFSLDQIHTVRAIHETFGRRCAPILTGITGRPVEVHCHAVDQLTYREFMESIPPISALIPFTMSPLKGSMLMQIDGTLAQYLVRTACGSVPVDALAEPARGLTEIECIVLRDVVEQVVPAIDESWRTAIDLTSGVIDIQTDPQTVQIVPPTEMIVLGSMEVVIGESTGFINFAIPYLTIEPIIGRLSAQWWYGQVRSASTITGSARAAGVPVDAQLFAEAEPVRLADLSAVVAGEPFELATLSTGLARIAAGGVTVAEVAVDPMELSAAEPLTLTVTAHPSDSGAAAITGPAGDESPVPAFLSTAVDA
ncbi:MAG: flagellar motor switch protein FliM, partial [Spirochaetaceae bacterium]|nr:flagellar motor switch protein FliM [Spirochaetaceae bacterium]